MIFPKRVDRQYFTGDDLYNSAIATVVDLSSLEMLSSLRFQINSKIIHSPKITEIKIENQRPNAKLVITLDNKERQIYLYDAIGSEEIDYYIFDENLARQVYQFSGNAIHFKQSLKTISNLHILVQAVRDFIKHNNLSTNPSFTYLDAQGEINSIELGKCNGIIEVSGDCSILILKFYYQDKKFQLFFNL